MWEATLSQSCKHMGRGWAHSRRPEEGVWETTARRMCQYDYQVSDLRGGLWVEGGWRRKPPEPDVSSHKAELEMQWEAWNYSVGNHCKPDV